MNLQDQIGALEAGVDQLIQTVAALPAAPADETASVNSAANAAADAPPNGARADEDAQEAPEAGAHQNALANDAPSTPQPTLEIARPSQNEITMTIGGQSVSLHPAQIGQLIEELANARASMLPEPPPDIPPGWRFASTRNPVMAVQKQSNGDRLLVLRHTGHGWVPFTFSPDMAIQLYMMLTQR